MNPPAPAAAPRESLLERTQNLTPEQLRAQVLTFTGNQLEQLIQEMDAAREVPPVFKEAMVKEAIEQRLAEEGKTLEGVRAKWQALRARIELSMQQLGQPQQPAGQPAEAKGKFDQALDAVLPENLTQNQKRAIGYATVGLAAVAGVMALRWLFAKDEAEKSGGGFFKKALILGTVGILGIGAYKYLSGKGLLGEARDAARQKKDEMEERGKAAIDKGREGTREGAEIVSASLAGKALALQYDVAKGLGLDSPRPLLEDAEEVITLAKRRDQDVNMGQILDCMDATPGDDAPYEHFLRAVYREEYNSRSPEKKKKLLLAAKLVVGFLKKHRDTLEQSAQYTEQGNLRNLSFGEGLNIIARTPAAARTLTAELGSAIVAFAANQQVPNPKEVFRDVFENKEFYSEELLLRILAPLRREGINARSSPEEKQRFREEARRVITLFLTSGNVKVRSIDTAIQVERWEEGSNEAAMAKGICENIRTADGLRTILGAALVPTDASRRTRDDQAVAEKLTSLLQEGEISLPDALQLHYLLHSGKSGSALLTFKVIHLLEKSGASDLSTERYYKLTKKFTETLSENASQWMDELHLDEETKAMLKNMGLYAQEEVGKAVEKLWHHMKEFSRKYPVVAGIIGLTTLGGTYATVGRPLMNIYQAVRWRNIEQFSKMDDAAIQVFARQNMVDPNQVKSAVKETQDIVQRLAGRSAGGTLPGERFLSRYRGFSAIEQAKALSPEVIKKMELVQASVSQEIAKLHQKAADLPKVVKNPEELAREVQKINEQIEAVSKSYMRRSVLAAANNAADNLGQLPKTLRKQVVDQMLLQAGPDIPLPNGLRMQLIKRGTIGRIKILAPMIAIRKVLAGEEASLAAVAASTTIQFIPVVGTGYDFLSAMTGRDVITKEKVGRLSSLGFAIAGLGCDVLTIVGVGAGARVAIKGGKVVAKGVDAARLIKGAKIVRRAGVGFSIAGMAYEWLVDPKEVGDIAVEE